MSSVKSILPDVVPAPGKRQHPGVASGRGVRHDGELTVAVLVKLREHFLGVGQLIFTYVLHFVVVLMTAPLVTAEVTNSGGGVSETKKMGGNNK